MKLWMVITIFGKIVGSIGPLPYTMDECLFRAAINDEVVKQNWMAGKRAIFEGRVITPGDIAHGCVYAYIRPEFEL